MEAKHIIAIVICIIILGGCSFLTLTPGGIAISNIYKETLQKVDDRTSYDTKKKVEDTCRAYITQYKTNKTTYEQYKDSDSELERSWAQSAKMQANKTVNIYNEYILKNSYVFDGNVPEDIKMELEILE